MDKKRKDELREFARAVVSELRRNAGRKGGRARADKLTPAERSERSRHAARARWKRTAGKESTDG